MENVDDDKTTSSSTISCLPRHSRSAIYVLVNEIPLGWCKHVLNDYRLSEIDQDKDKGFLLLHAFLHGR